MRKFLLLLTLVFMSICKVNAQASGYTFSSSSGTYTAITGGTVIKDGSSTMDSYASGAITIPSFTFNGTSYTTAYATSNGFITLGGSAPSAYTSTGISSNTGSGIAICPMSADLDRANTNATTEMRWETVGDEVVFQWKQMKRYGQTENFDFQARLNTVSGVITFVYQLNSGPGTGTSYQPQVGIRTSTTDFKNRLVASGSETWATSLAGTLNNNTCRFTAASPAKSFTSGQTYTFTPPACFAPSSLSAGSVTNSSASISFAGAGSAFILEYGAPGFTPGTDNNPGVGGTIVTGSASPIAISGLTANTTYDVYIRQDCGGGIYSVNSAKVTFTTLCDAVTTYPYTEGFNSVGVIPSCWSVAEGSPGASYHWQAVAADATHGAGSAAEGAAFMIVNYYNASTTYNPYYLKSVPFDLGASAKRAKFAIWMGANSGTNNLKFEISNDGGTTWTTLDTYTANPANSSSSAPWDSKTVDLSSYTNQTVIFRLNATSNFGSGYCNIGFDNFVVEDLPACAEPTGLSAGSVTNNAASISFTSGGNNFILEYGAAGFTPGTDNNPGVGGTIVTGSASPIAVSSLTANTTYDVYVRQDCGGGVYSPNSSKATFTTACDVVSSYPWTEDFNSVTTPALPSCFSAIDANTDGDKWITYTGGYGVGGSICAGLYTDFNSGANNDYLVLPAFNLTGNQRLSFAVRARSAGEPNDYRVVLSTTGNDASDFTTVLKPLTTVSNTTMTNIDWIDLSSYTGIVYIAIHVPSGGLDGYYLYVDDIVVEDMPACAEPSGLSMGSITNNAASASFTSGGSAFIVEYGAPGFTPGTDDNAGVGGTIVTGSASPIALSGLTANTTYDVYVRLDCGGGVYSVNSTKATFTTACDLVTDFTQNFDAVTVPALPTCWAKVGATGTVNTQTSGAYSSPNNLYIYSTSGSNIAMIRMPEVSNADAGTHRLRFKARANFTIGGKLQVGYLTDPTDQSTFVQLGTDYTTTSISVYDNFELSPVAAPSGITTLAIRHTGVPANSILIDDVVYEAIPACAEPSALSMGSITQNAASASFTSGGTAFIVEYGAPGFTPGTDDNAGVGGTIVTGSASPIALSGLTANTTYDVYVRQDCGGGIYSPNSAKVTFTTLCDATNVPYTQNFESATVPALPACSSMENLGTGNNWVTVSNPGDGFTTKALKYGYSDTDAANVWFYTQGVNLTNGVAYTISYNYGNNSTTYAPEKLKVAYGTAANNGAMINVLADHPNINQSAIQSNTVVFTPSATGVYYFGFHAYSDADKFNLYVDNIMIDVAPWTWTGTTNTDWNTASNWDLGSVPTSTSNVIIPNVANKPVVGAGTYAAKNATINTGSSLTINGTLQVNGNITNNATITGAGSLALNGITAQTFNVGTVGATIASFSLNNTSGATLSGTGKLNVTDVLTVQDGSTLTTGGVVVLKSDASNTARLAPVGTGIISGDVTVERFIPAKASRSWSLLSSPITQSLQNSWQQQIHLTGAGTGGTICPTLTAHSNGFDATLTNASNIYTYNAAGTPGNRWTAVASTNADNLMAGKGFRVNVRGDRSLGCDLLNGVNMTPSAVTLKSTGSISNSDKNMGSFSITYPNAGINNYVLVGNPYPSALSFSALQGANGSSISTSYAVYIPASAPGVYSYWSDDDGFFTGGVGYDNATGNILANGQAFFVQSSVAGDVTLNFSEAQKTTETNTGYFRTARVFNEKLKVNYLKDNQKVDEVVIRYANDATVSNTAIGKMDIPSMNSGTYITSLKDNKGMVVQTRELQSLTTDEVWLNIGATESGNYQLNFSNYENFAGASIILKDHYTQTEQDVKQNATYSFSIDKDNAATKGNARFSIVFNRTIEPVYVTNMIKMYPNPANKQVTLQLPQSADNSIVYQIKVTDLVGKVIMQQKANGGTTQFNIDRLTTGTYLVEIIDSKGNRTTEKLVKQ